ncbi:MAG: peptidase M14, partial [Rhodothermales bacterium]|nr:peptidase M14 [Rhodothermales bacterium]
MFACFSPRILLIVAVIGLTLSWTSETAVAQDLPFHMDVPVEGVDSYDPSIPTPESVVGHVIGTRHTTPAEVVEYFRAVARASDRVVLVQHAETYEGNPLIHAIVTSPSNHGRLERIRTANQRLSDAPESVGAEDIAGMPIVVYQGYSIHGDESSGTEAAVLYLYHLAAGRGPAVDDALSEAVVLLDPLFNPDGRDRFVDWVNRNRGRVPVSDTQDREHNQEWPGGRTNHYWFDLNRDWLPAQHPESQGRLRVFHDWRPQILTDHHEMGTGSTFFFQPGIPSRNNPNTPERTFELTGALAEYHARRLDSVGAGYYTRESFDDFYYGKGSTYPDINGAIGVLFEQASSRALVSDSDAGTLHFAFTVRNQFLASLSTLEGAVALRREFLTHQRDFYADAFELADQSAVEAWLIGAKRGRTRAEHLAQLLRRHRVEIHELAGDVRVDGTTYAPGEAFVVPAGQAQYRLLKAAFERTLSYGDSLFYDVSTWTLPLAFDVDFHEVRGDVDELLGQRIDAVMPGGGETHGELGGVAWIMSWQEFYAPSALAEILDRGYAARMMRQEFTAVVDGRNISFPRGSVVIPTVGRYMPGEEPDPAALGSLVEDLADRYHVRFWAAETALTPEGPDLGARSAATLSSPRIGLVTGSGTSSYLSGEAWHAMSERFGLPVSLLEASRIG